MSRKTILLIILLVAAAALTFWIYTQKGGFFPSPQPETIPRLQTTFDEEMLTKLKSLKMNGIFPLQVTNKGRTDPFSQY